MQAESNISVMRRFLGVVLFLLIVASCSRGHQTVALQDGKWAPEVRESLNNLMANHGKDAYAVFDFDKTSIVHDISQALWVYQIEHLRYADAPAHDFLDGIPSPDEEMSGTGVSYAAMGRAMSSEYMTLKSRLDDGESLETIRQSDDFLDFRARMNVFLTKMDEQYGSWVSYLWQPGLLVGFTRAEADALIRDAISEHLGKEKLGVERWTSPDGRWDGDVQRGIWVSPEMKDLYKCLEEAGIDVYICSASLESIVEVLACDANLGFGIEPERVFGLRFVAAERIVPEFDADYKQPNREGKIDCIKAYMAPSYGGADPLLVAGDSIGDVPMLTAFPAMRHGLIIDVGRSPESPIGQLAVRAREEQNAGLYLLQPSFEL